MARNFGFVWKIICFMAENLVGSLFTFSRFWSSVCVWSNSWPRTLEGTVMNICHRFLLWNLRSFGSRTGLRNFALGKLLKAVCVYYMQFGRNNLKVKVCLLWEALVLYGRKCLWEIFASKIWFLFVIRKSGKWESEGKHNEIAWSRFVFEFILSALHIIRSSEKT